MICLILLVGSGALFGCTATEELKAGDTTSSTLLATEDSALGGEVSASASEAVKKINQITEQLLAVKDPCKLIQSNQVNGLKLDPTALSSVAARKAVGEGLNKVYAHAQTIVNDPAVSAALAVQLATFQKILDMVNRYVGVPTNSNVQAQVEALLAAPEMAAANQTVAAWLSAKCAAGAK